jgi:hypothetical protein
MPEKSRGGKLVTCNSFLQGKAYDVSIDQGCDAQLHFLPAEWRFHLHHAGKWSLPALAASALPTAYYPKWKHDDDKDKDHAEEQ